ELSGNLCRCTGYVGIVRAITRVLGERRAGALGDLSYQAGPIGPVGARVPQAQAEARAATVRHQSAPSDSVLGVAGRAPNVEMRQSFTVARPPDEVWASLADVMQVVSCLPGASLVGPPAGDRFEGRMAIKLGPITASFSGHARILRDDTNKRGTI